MRLDAFLSTELLKAPTEEHVRILKASTGYVSLLGTRCVQLIYNGKIQYFPIHRLAERILASGRSDEHTDTVRRRGYMVFLEVRRIYTSCDRALAAANPVSQFLAERQTQFFQSLNDARRAIDAGESPHLALSSTAYIKRFGEDTFRKRNTYGFPAHVTRIIDLFDAYYINPSVLRRE